MENERRIFQHQNGKRLVFTFEPNNVVKYQTLPQGEEGVSRPFPNSTEAERFAVDIAHEKGFKRIDPLTNNNSSSNMGNNTERG